jgi:DNA-binding MarR family transcriptional regulator
VIGFPKRGNPPPSEGKRASIHNLNVTSIDAASSNSSRGSKRKTKPFVQVPTSIVRDGNLSPQAFRLYAVIVSYTWNDPGTWVGQDKLAEAMGYSRRQTVAKWAGELARAGLIEIEANRPEKDRRRNYYRLIPQGDRCANAHIDTCAKEHKTNKQSTKTQKPGGTALREPIPNTVSFTPSPSLATTSHSATGINEETQIGARARTYVGALDEPGPEEPKRNCFGPRADCLECGATTFHYSDGNPICAGCKASAQVSS